MQIQRIEIIGFKSFVDKTVLNFEDGITAILGPNGCGKSNIIDAIRWGMGEQNAKNLRGQAMEDVIFGGSEKRRAHGMAEVTMVFSNPGNSPDAALNDYTEVMVTRRLYRNGDSEYLMNKTPCRLKDIAELFMDTGVGARAYSIIEQGKIGTILHARPEERRVLIEEVAGVTKYKVRKRAALRKIELTRQNLTRLNDVIDEVESQLNGLRRQANKAQSFRDLRQKIKELDLSLSSLHWRELDEQAARFDSELAQIEAVVVAADAKVGQMELTLERQRLSLGEAEDDASRLQAQLFQREAELQRVENQLAMSVQQRTHLTAQFDELTAELELTQKHDVRRGVEIEKVKELKVDVERQRQQLEQDQRALLDQVTQRNDQEQLLRCDLDGLRRSVLESHGDRLRQQGQHDHALQRLELLAERKARYCAEQMTVAERQQEVRDDQQRCEQQLEQVENLYADGELEQQVLQDQQRQQQSTLQQIRAELEECRNRYLRCTSHVESLEELSAARVGCLGGIKEVLNHPSLGHLFRNTLADGLHVTEGYDIAVATVLGDQLHGLPLDNVAALQAVDDVIPSDLACLFQLSRNVQSPAFTHGIPLIDLINTSATITPFWATLVQGCFCVESLRPFMAENLPVGVTLVTREGEQLDWQGRFVRGGGTTESHQVLKNKRRLDELRLQVITLGEQLANLTAGEAGLAASVALRQSEIHEHEKDQHRRQINIEELVREQARCKQEFDRWRDRSELLTFELEQGGDEEDVLHGEKQRALTAVQELEKKTVGDEIYVKELELRWQECVDLLKQEQQQLTQIQVQIAQVRERARSFEQEIEREQGAALGQQRREKQLRERINELAKQQAELVEERENYDQRLQVLMAYRQQDQVQLDGLKEKVATAAATVEEGEHAIKVGRLTAQSQHEQHSIMKMSVQQCHLDRDHLRQGVMDKYHIDFRTSAEHLNLIDDKLIPADAENKLTRLRERLDGFGEVNLMAIEEFNALDERYTFLTDQRDDLQRSVDDLHAAISQINRTTRRRFKEAFEQVNAKFQEVFPRLFVGGDASLSLTDEGDLLESGIEIVAQPPGKKLQNVSLLSGGEKALTAVALIFAIFLIKPSPFCILDEVDAPLDDANIGRFNEMVQEMSSASQFMIITHNTRTMEIADTLFGVTMEDPGVSNLVAVRVGDFVS